MAVINLLQHQLEKSADVACHRRNQNLPFDVGTASYERIEQGVQFIQHHYKLDSTHSDYSSIVAKIVYDVEPCYWSLSLLQQEQGVEMWVPYPYLSGSHTLADLIETIVMDPQHVIWFEP